MKKPQWKRVDSLFAWVAIVIIAFCTSCSSVNTSGNIEAKSQTISYYLPDPWIQVDIYEESTISTNRRYHVRVQSLAVANTSTEYRMKLKHGMGTTDRLRVSVDRAGLLKRITYNQRQRGTDSAVALGKAAIQIASMMFGVPIKGAGEPPEFSRLVARRVFAVDANGDISGDRTIRGFGGPNAPDFVVSSKNIEGQNVEKFDKGPDWNKTDDFDVGFVYHPLRPIEVQVRQVGGDPSVFDISGIIYVPNNCQIRKFEVPSRWVVGEQSFDFAFSDGMLSEVSLIQESGLYEVLSVPGRILGVVTGLPAKLISIDVNRTEPDPKTFGDDDKDVPRIRPRLDKD